MFGDLKFAIRSLLKSPGFTAVAVLTLAVAIGACTTLFSVLHAVVLRPLSYPDSDSLALVWSLDPAHGIERSVISWPKYELLKAQRDTFADAAAYVGGSFPLKVGDGQTQEIPGLHVSANWLSLLGLKPLRGRHFTPTDDREGAAAVMMISDALWRNQFGADPAILGKVVAIEDVSHEIVAVLPRMPAPFDTVDIIVPRPTEIPTIPRPAQRYLPIYQTLVRLAANVTLEQANQRVDVIAREFNAHNSAHLDAVGRNELRSLKRHVLGGTERTFWVLAAAVMAVLLIACANVANLFIARAARRRQDTLVRLSLGARRRDIARTFIAESLLFSLAASVAGAVFAWGGVKTVLALFADHLPRAAEVTLNPLVLLWALGAALICALVIGVFPIWDVRHLSQGRNIQASGLRVVGGRVAPLFRTTLIVVQIQFSLVLVTCAGLLALSFYKLLSTDPGFDVERTAFGAVHLPSAKYNTPALTHEFFRQLEAQLRAAPELIAAGAVAGLPINGMVLPVLPYASQGKPFLPMPQGPGANAILATPGYFPAMGIQLREGRFFTDQDRIGAAGVVVINETLARRISPHGSPLGQVLTVGSAEGIARIVGIIRDVKSAGIAVSPPDEIYLPYAQLNMPFGFLTVVGKARPGLDTSAVIPVLRRVLAKVDASVPLDSPQTLKQLVRGSLSVQRLAMLLLLSFAAIAVLLAGVGIYSVLAYAVAQRTSELGIRTALGAQARQIVLLILSQGMRLVAVGLILGLVVAAGATRLIASMLYQVEPLDPLVLGSMTALFAAIAFMACLIPSWRASRIDPIAALRAE